MFTVPAIRMADTQVTHNPNTRLYRFDWSAQMAGSAWGGHHFIEVPFAFDQLDNDQARGFLGYNPPCSLTDATHGTWVSFIRDEDPNHGGLSNWPQYDPQTRPTMLFDEPWRVENRPADEEPSLWKDVV